MVNRTPNRSSPLGYYPALDGLRGLAILFVLWFHIGVRQFQGGWLGVDIFFVLSGFLITSILLREWDKTGAVHFKNFYLRRVLRLLPAYVLVVAIILAIDAVGGFRAPGLGAPAWKVIAYTATSTVNFSRALIAPTSLHAEPLGPIFFAWSLSIEEQFYLIWPPVMVLMLKRGARRRSIAIALLCVVLLIEGWRAWLWHQGHSAAIWHIRYGTDTRTDGIVLGCFLALLPPGFVAKHVPVRAINIGAIIALLALCVSAVVVTEQRESYNVAGLTLTVWASAIIVVALTQGNQFPALTQVFSLPVLVWLGRVSYGLYLYNLPITWLKMHRQFADPYSSAATWVDRAVTFAVILLVAALSYYVFESPFLKMKDRLARRAVVAA